MSEHVVYSSPFSAAALKMLRECEETPETATRHEPVVGSSGIQLQPKQQQTGARGIAARPEVIGKNSAELVVTP